MNVRPTEQNSGEDRIRIAEDAYRQAIEDQYFTVSPVPTVPMPDSTYQVFFRPHDATDWQALGYTTGPITDLDYGAPDPADESAVLVWPRQYGKTAALTTTLETPLTGSMRALFDALLAGHRARLDRRLRRLARDLDAWEPHVRLDFQRVQQVLEDTGVGDGYGRLTIPQPVHPPIEPPTDWTAPDHSPAPEPPPSAAGPAMPELTDEQREQLARSVAEVTALMRRWVESLVPAVTAAAQDLARAFATLQQAGLVDEDGRPTRPADRPAWASPYGPPPKRS